ncbi:MAG: hypothetical protein HRT35_17100, partial [Algicola sp.]|nr:hypothetical protein [Algicola sp.]
PTKAFNCGAFEGLGGVVYLIAHLYHLWQAPWLLAFGHIFCEKLAKMVASDDSFDIMSGSAGAVLSLLSYFQVTNDSQILAIACHFGDHLVDNFCEIKGGWPNSTVKGRVLNGFSHGNAGIAYALMRLYRHSTEGSSKEGTSESRIDSYQQVAIKAIRHEQSSYCPDINNWLDLRFDDKDQQQKQAMTAWCNGSMGIGYSRLLLQKELRKQLQPLQDLIVDNELTLDIRRAATDVLSKPQLKDHGLCHGHFGNQEFVQQLMLSGQIELSESRFNANINDYLSGMNDNGLLAGREGIEQLGLMDGLAGIGYQLLKFALPHQLPSILMLQAPVI